MCTGFEWLPALFESAEALTAIEGMAIGAEGIGAIGAAEGVGAAAGAAWGGIEGGIAGFEGFGAGVSAGDLAAGGFGGLEGAGGFGWLEGTSGFGSGEALAGGPGAGFGLSDSMPIDGAPGQGGFINPSDAGMLGGPSTEALAQGGFSSFGSGGFGDVSGLGGFGTPAPASGFDWSGAMKYASPAMSVLSGLQGQQQARAMRKAAMKADPWGTSGGRAAASAQLQDLMSNPMGAAGRDPSYALRIQGAQRANAMYGQDSGAMSVAGANASTDWYNARLAQLGGLAGAGTSNGATVSGLGAAANLQSQSLASMGYGITRGAGGNPGMMTPEQQQALLAMYMKKGP